MNTFKALEEKAKYFISRIQEQQTETQNWVMGDMCPQTDFNIGYYQGKAVAFETAMNLFCFAFELDFDKMDNAVDWGECEEQEDE